MLWTTCFLFRFMALAIEACTLHCFFCILLVLNQASKLHNKLSNPISKKGKAREELISRGRGSGLLIKFLLLITSRWAYSQEGEGFVL